MAAQSFVASEAVSKRCAPFYARETDSFITSGQRQIDEIRCSAHFMSERFGSKIDSTRFLSQSWARFMIQKRQDKGSWTRLVMRIVHSRKPLAFGSPSREFAMTRATISSSQADLVQFLITKRVREPGYRRNDTSRGRSFHSFAWHQRQVFCFLRPVLSRTGAVLPRTHAGC